MKFLKKVLIANRGEIACRIMRTTRRLGIPSVAIFSDIDRGTRFVRLADQAHRVGTNPSSESYLLGNKIIQLAKETGSEGIHPGFGFLSQNAAFADSCNQAGIKFIGPSSNAIRKMGSKSESKNIMEAAGVPCVPGYHGENQDSELLLSQAKRITFPVLIKAVSGGGGKGMRIVHSAEQFMAALQGCKRQAMKSFSDDRVLVQKYITRPRHIEVQIFGDSHGNYVHLHQRDCSIQRRHQKVVQQAPSRLPKDKQDKLFQSAVLAAKAVKYENAGTVEFIFDLDAGKHYFMEMNTRLQVEHPISEMITGQDFVQWQLRVASGQPLPLKQADIIPSGHAFQVRIYSQNPFNDFLPANGRISHLREPSLSPSVRVQTGIESGDTISTFYDPMIAKLVTHGPNREKAAEEMAKALRGYRVVGLVNNIPFLKRVMDHPTFRGGDYDTGFIGKYKQELLEKQKLGHIDLLAALGVRFSKIPQGLPTELSGFRNVPGGTKTVQIQVSAPFLSVQETVTVQVETIGSTFKVGIQDKNYQLEVKVEDGRVLMKMPQMQVQRQFFQEFDSHVSVFDADKNTINFKFEDDFVTSKIKVEKDEKRVAAPMPGTIVKVCGLGPVKKGDVLVIMEAMKMEHTLKAPRQGIVRALHVKTGQFVSEGELLVDIE